MLSGLACLAALPLALAPLFQDDLEAAASGARLVPGLEALASTALQLTAEPGVFHLQLPGERVSVDVFQNDPGPGHPWHGLIRVTDPRLFSFRPVRRRLADLVLGDGEPESVVVIASSADEKVPISHLPSSARALLEPFGGEEGELELGTGANFFCVLQPGRTGALGVLNRFLGVTKQPTRVSGLVDRNTLELLLRDTGLLEGLDEKAREEKVAATKIRLSVEYPPLTPPPFGRIESKDLVHVTYPSTSFSIEASGEDTYELEGEQAVRLWLLGRQIDVVNHIAFHQEEDGYSLDIEGTRSTDWQDMLGIEGFAVKEVSLSASIAVKEKKAGKSGSSTSEAAAGSKDGSSDAAAHGSSSGNGSGKASEKKGSPKRSATGDLAIATVIEFPRHGKVRGLVELGLDGDDVKTIQLRLEGADGDKGINLAALPVFGLLPASDRLWLDDVVVGVQPSTKGVYLQGQMTWADKDITARGAVLRRKVEGGKEAVIGFLGVQGLSLRKLVPVLPEKADMLALDRAMLVVSTQDVERMKSSDLPLPVRDMVADVTAGSDIDIPVHQGLGVFASLDPAALAPEAKQAFEQLGVLQPLVLGGSIGGVLGGDPSIALYADLPNLPIPRMGRNPLPLRLESAGLKLFLEASASAGKTSLDLGLDGAMTLLVGDDELEFGGRLFLTLSAVSQGIRLGGRMRGTWDEPFQLQGIAFSDLELEGGFDPPTSSLSVRVLGSALLGKLKYSVGGDIKVIVMANPPWCVPKVIGLRFEGSEISGLTLAQIQGALVRGAIGGPLANTIPDGEMKSLLQRVAGRDVVGTIEEVVPLPYLKFQDVALFLMTPGAEVGDLGDGVGGLGVAVRGRAMFMGRSLGETDCFLTLQNGMRMYASPGDLNLGPLLQMRGAAFDVRVPMPGLQRDEQAYTRLTGSMGAGCSSLEGSLDMFFSRDLARFAASSKIAGYQAMVQARADLSRWPDFKLLGIFDKELIADTLHALTARIGERIAGAKAEAEKRIAACKAELDAAEARAKEALDRALAEARREVDAKIEDIRSQIRRRRDDAPNAAVAKAWDLLLNATLHVHLDTDGKLTGLDAVVKALDAVHDAARGLIKEKREQVQDAVAALRRKIDEAKDAARGLVDKARNLPAVVAARKAVDQARGALQKAQEDIAGKTIDPIAAWIEDAGDTLVIEEIGFDAGLEALCEKRLPRLEVRGSFKGRPFHVKGAMEIAAKDELARKNAKLFDELLKRLFEDGKR